MGIFKEVVVVGAIWTIVYAGILVDFGTENFGDDR